MTEYNILGVIEKEFDIPMSGILSDVLEGLVEHLIIHELRERVEIEMVDIIIELSIKSSKHNERVTNEPNGVSSPGLRLVSHSH